LLDHLTPIRVTGR